MKKTSKKIFDSLSCFKILDEGLEILGFLNKKVTKTLNFVKFNAFSSNIILDDLPGTVILIMVAILRPRSRDHLLYLGLHDEIL